MSIDHDTEPVYQAEERLRHARDQQHVNVLQESDWSSRKVPIACALCSTDYLTRGGRGCYSLEVPVNDQSKGRRV